MMSKQQFARLKAGDIVVFNERPRTVMCGPADYGDRPAGWNRGRGGNTRAWPPMCVSFPIAHRSWTGRAYTVYGYNDVKHRLRMPHKQMDRKNVCEAELSRLRSNRFNPVHEMEREIAEQERLAEILGWRRDSALRLARAKLKRLKRKVRR